MKAAVYHGAGDIRIEDVPDPTPGAGELLLEIHAVGICGTDVGEFVHGPMSYAVNGRQYVAINAGSALFVYALRQ